MPHFQPIIIVTGANSGVGFGICERLLIQLSYRRPPDALVQLGWTAEDDKVQSFDGLTLIMACRNLKLAEAAREQLYAMLDTHIRRIRKASGYDGHAEAFRRNVQIVVHYVDLASIDTVFNFVDIVSAKYPYISHLICNAGVASYSGIDWPALAKQVLCDPLGAVSDPVYGLENVGECSGDGLGWVWQCNVFSHYVLYRSLRKNLTASHTTPRVVWMSSSTAKTGWADPDDWQLLKSAKSYEASKHHMELLGTRLDLTDRHEVRHLVVQPGISKSNISKGLTGFFFLMDWLQLLIFYLARILGSVEHTISGYTAASSSVQVSLVPLSRTTVFSGAPVKYCAQVGKWGTEQLGIKPIYGWEESIDESAKLLQRCEMLFREFVQSERAQPAASKA